MAVLAGAPGLVVEGIRLYALRLPLRRPMHMAGSVIRETENLLVRLLASDGSEGWGEAASAPTMTGETLPGMLAAAERLVPLAVGQPLAGLDEAQRRMGLALYGNASVKSAFETAWLDAAGRAGGQPLAALLRADATAEGRPFALQWMLGSGVFEADIAEAGERRAAGFRVFKVKVGGDPVADAQRTLAVAARLGPSCLLSADANQGWSKNQAIAYVEHVGPGVLAFLEQPVAANDLAAMAEVARRAPMPIGSDEGIHGIGDIERHHACGAAAGVSLKPIKLGGLRATVAAAQRCAELGLHLNLACKVAESGISAAALLHVAAASPAVAWGMSLSNQYLLHDLAVTANAAGHAGVPAGAGLGITIDADVLKAYATPLPG